MVCPKWIKNKTQQIFIEDLIEYLFRSIEIEQTEGKVFDIGGPDVLTYFDMMKIYAKIINKSVMITIIPVLTPKLSSYLADLVTPVGASLARPLVESLKHEPTVKDHSIKKNEPPEIKDI